MRIRLAATGFGVVMMAGVLMGCGPQKPGETDVLNVSAKLPAGLPAPVMDWRVVTSGVDRAHGTMSTLTANDAAIFYTGVGKYPAGSALALTTWAQREDPHWFGARIPGGFASVELVTFAKGADGQTTATYRRFVGDPVHEVTGAADAETRKAAILGMRNAEMP